MDALRRECEVVDRYWQIRALPGVEMTHVPPRPSREVARRARAAGAAVVEVHGETVVEPVEPGTNRAAIDCDEVDVLAHPGLLTAEDAARAAAPWLLHRGHEPQGTLARQRARRPPRARGRRTLAIEQRQPRAPGSAHRAAGAGRAARRRRARDGDRYYLEANPRSPARAGLFPL